jgi:hypothetical protein
MAVLPFTGDARAAHGKPSGKPHAEAQAIEKPR